MIHAIEYGINQAEVSLRRSNRPSTIPRDQVPCDGILPWDVHPVERDQTPTRTKVSIRAFAKFARFRVVEVMNQSEGEHYVERVSLDAWRGGFRNIRAKELPPIAISRLCAGDVLWIQIVADILHR